MVYDLPEPDFSLSKLAAIEQDLKIFKEKLKTLSPELVALVSRLSIGTRDTEKCRPLKIDFENPHTATEFLVKNRAGNPRIFSTSSDKTSRERAYLKELRAELQR